MKENEIMIVMKENNEIMKERKWKKWKWRNNQ